MRAESGAFRVECLDDTKVLAGAFNKLNSKESLAAFGVASDPE